MTTDDRAKTSLAVPGRSPVLLSTKSLRGAAAVALALSLMSCGGGGGGGSAPPKPVTVAGVMSPRITQGAAETVLAFRVSLRDNVAFPVEVSFNTSGAATIGSSCSAGVDYTIPATANLTSSVNSNTTGSGKLTLASAAADRHINVKVCPGSTTSDKTVTLIWNDGATTGSAIGTIRGAASTVVANSMALNDTGITSCANADANGLACPQAGFARQDAETGRDTDTVITGIGSNKTSAFSYTALSGGKCFQDNVTGLVWEAKTGDGGLHDGNATYSWFNDNATTNGGSAGTAAGGVCTGVAGGCDTQKFVAAVNAEALCGFNDWRMPTAQELTSLVDSSASTGAAASSVLSNQFASAAYWSSSPKAQDGNGAWIVDFASGASSFQDKSLASRVRLVRGR